MRILFQTIPPQTNSITDINSGNIVPDQHKGFDLWKQITHSLTSNQSHEIVST